jgi:DNA-binding NtrC family response regulator
MSMLTQSKLLRVLQEKRFERVGGNESIGVDVRIIAATNKSLVQLMKEGSFRVDLFYRLKVVSVYIPPLRERREDVPLLVDYFLNRFSKQLSVPLKQVSKKAQVQMARYHWPGNVRELENNVHTAMVMSKNESLSPEDFPSLTENNPKLEINLTELQDDYTDTFKKIIDPIMPKLIANSSGQVYHFMESALERAMIASCLKQFEGNQVKTAEALGISRNTLRDRIAKYGIY